MARHPHVVATALLVASVLPGLAACGSSPSAPEQDACHRIDVWRSGQGTADELDRAVAEAQDALAGTGDSPLASALEQLEGSPAADRTGDADRVLAACRDLGWEPPEG